MSTHHLAQSAEKGVLWKRLGIQSEADHRMMLNEASDGRDRLSCNPANLTDASLHSRVQPPYRWDQITETAKHKEMLNIFARASLRTRHFYDKAHYSTQVRQGEWVEENWAIRWFLWHSFRYRDNRDNRASRNAMANHAVGVSQTRYYDTARSQWVPYPL